MNKNCFLLFLFPILTSSQNLPTICLENNACYQGSWISSFNSRYASFQGIRFAQPPIGALRFQAPMPYHEKEGTYDVGKESNVICPQNPSSVSGQEDCLFLNIYVPETVINDPQKMLPVMFWIYGGALVVGDYRYKNFGPNQFMKNGEVILVAVNYRLGPLGFLSMGNNMISGNAGMKDQVMALKWVKDNIKNFGGDPNLVTIFGESAGSLSVAMHIISPMSRGLFQRGILQSGTAIGPSWGTVTPEKAVRFANTLSEKLGCAQADNVVTCLQDKNMEDIVGISYNISRERMIWVPVSDKDFSSEPFLPGDAEELMKSGQFNSEVEVIIGTNEAEGIMTMGGYVIDPSLWEETKNNIETVLPMYMFKIGEEMDITDQDVDNMYKILNYYIVIGLEDRTRASK